MHSIGHKTLVTGDTQDNRLVWFILYHLLFIRSYFFSVYSRHRFDLTRSETLSHGQRVSVYLNAINLVRSINVVNDFIFTCPQKLNFDMCVPSANKYTAIRTSIVRHSIIICTFVYLNALHASIIDS